MIDHAPRLYLHLPHHHHGLTLLEILITVTIITITLGAGVPTLSKWLEIKTASNTLINFHHLVTYARTKAVKENNYLTLCPSNNQKDCNSEWNKTIILFMDSNKNEQVDDGETLYRIAELPPKTPCLKWTASLGRSYLQFKPSGATNGTSGSFSFCDTHYSSKKLVVSFNGRTSFKSL